MKRYSISAFDSFDIGPTTLVEEDESGDWVRAEDAEAELEYARQDRENLNALYVAASERAKLAQLECERLRAELEAYRIAENRP